MQKIKKRFLISLIVIVCAWFSAGLTDYLLVLNDRRPVFCVNDMYEYFGLGYRFEICKKLNDTHTFEYSYYIFGILVDNNITNSDTIEEA